MKIKIRLVSKKQTRVAASDNQLEASCISLQEREPLPTTTGNINVDRQATSATHA